MYHLIKQPAEQLQVVFRNTAQRVGVYEAIVEKDFHLKTYFLKSLHFGKFKRKVPLPQQMTPSFND